MLDDPRAFYDERVKQECEGRAMVLSSAAGPQRKANPWQGVFVLVAACLASFIASAASAQTSPSFYTATQQELAGRPGTIIRKEPLTGYVPPGASAFRILYRSTGLHGEPIAVSGVLVAPLGVAPAAGRPIVAWSHPTSGVDQPCAPSLSPSALQMIQGLPEMLRRGYVVVATDYPGLGTAGPHPYLVGLSEGRAVLDAVRAAGNLPEAHAGKRFVLWGHSQGGHASLYAALLAHKYAPELKLVGVAVAAPASDLTKLSSTNANSPDGQLLSAMLIWSWSRVFDTPLGQVVALADIPSVELLARQCFDPPLDSDSQPVAKPLAMASYKLTADLATAEPWHDLSARNTPGALPANVPVFLAQGSADTTIPPALTASYMRKLCQAGSAVHMMVLPGVDHRLIAHDAAGAAVDWMSGRLAGQPAPNDCQK
jgi:acetyl esterase/lipase